MRFSTLWLATLFGLVSCAKNVTRPKYIIISNNDVKDISTANSKDIVTAYGNRTMDMKSIGNTKYHFVSDLSAAELKRLNSTVVENTRVRANWHQKRIVQRSAGDSNVQFPYLKAEYVNMYIIDTGVDLAHPEFRNNNRLWGYNFVQDDIDTDCDGHGTHVASLSVGEQYGVARRANLIALKVLDCEGNGYTSDIIAAIQWATDHAKNSRNKRRSIINMSLGGSYNRALNNAVKAARSQGIYVVVAAGNENDDACNSSPGTEPSAITVAASDPTDKRAPWSNSGPCVDVYAPGVNLTAAWPDNKVAALSGTSMASPVAAGVLALYLSRSTLAGIQSVPCSFHEQCGQEQCN